MSSVKFILPLLLFSSSLFANDASDEYKKGLKITLSKPDSARVIFEHAIALSRKEKNDSLLAHSLFEYGKVCYETSKYSVAANAFEEAHAIYEKLNRNKDLAQVELSLGALFSKLGDHDVAGKHYISAKRRFAAMGNLSGELSADNAIGVMYFEKGDFKKAEDMFRDLRQRTPANDPSMEELHGNLAILFFYTGGLDSSLWYLRSAMAFSEKENNTDKVAVSWNNIGHVYQMKGMPDSAMICFEKSLALYRSIDSKSGICLVLGGIAQVHYRKKNYAVARKYFEESLEISTSLGLRNFAEHSSIRLARVEAETGNYKKAYDLLTLHLSYRDSSQDEKSDRLIEEMQARFNMEKKEAQIDSLRQQQILNTFQLKAQEEEATKRKYLIYGLLFIVVLVVVFGYFIYKAYLHNKQTNKLLTLRNQEIAQQNKEIKDSIRYAKHIQEAILPSDEWFKKLFPDSFVLYKPKDIVSGDFYWIEDCTDKLLIAAVDCTGHGVPGAFMSIVAHNGLTMAVNVNKLTRPAEILDYLTRHVNTILSQNLESATVRDGMDISLCSIDKKTGMVEYAGANNPLIIARKGQQELFEINADKQPVGNFSGVSIRPFTHHEVRVEKGDVIYLFSDGYADQFGGEKGKKFKYSRFKSLLKEFSGKSMQEQLHLLNTQFERWRGDLEQLDDVCVVGIQF
ncbi:MAG: tetratricopeptide repeat protein [Flavobacteriales bacterium]